MSYFKNILSIVLTATLASTAIAHDIVPDSHAAQNNKPTIINPGNNKAPVIQIAPPDKNGMSHNRYDSFSTNNGAIFSNNKGSVKHPLDPNAPQIQANPNLHKGTAKIIINEVTGKKASDLRGHISVAGDRADVIFSNPNGVKLNGVTISNSNHVVITTGKLKFSDQHVLQSYDVTQGTITVDGKGANFGNVDRVDLLARGIAINNKIWGKKAINVITGNNKIAHDTLEIKARKHTEKAPEVAIDMAALGGMYADKIHLVGTEKGFGVKTDESHDVLASNGFMLDFRKQLIIEKQKENTASEHENDINNPANKHGIIHLEKDTDRLYLGYGQYMDLHYPVAKEQVNGGYLNNGDNGEIIFTPDLSFHSGLPISENDIQSGPAYQPTQVAISPDIPGETTSNTSPLSTDGVLPATLTTPAKTPALKPQQKPVAPEDVAPKIVDNNDQSSSSGAVFGSVIIGGGATVAGGAGSAAGGIGSTVVGGGAVVAGGGILGTGVLTKPGLNPIQPSNSSAAGNAVGAGVSGGVVAASSGSSWANIASKPATNNTTNNAPANPAPNTSLGYHKPGTSGGYSGQNWKLDPSKQKNTYWNSYSENHVFQGDKNGGGHLYGGTDPTKSKFPKGWTSTQIKDVVDNVINNPKTTWRPSVNGNKTVTTLFNVDKQTVKVVLDPKTLNIVTTYPVGIVPKAPTYSFSNQLSNQIPALNKPPVNNNISNSLSPMGRHY